MPVPVLALNVGREYDGISPSRTDELKLLPLPLTRCWRRIVRGLWWSPIADPDRDDARDPPSDGGGSFDLADWTRSSSFCILPISPRIWYSEPDFGIPAEADDGARDRPFVPFVSFAPLAATLLVL